MPVSRASARRTTAETNRAQARSLSKRPSAPLRPALGLALLAARAQASSLHVGELCRGGECPDARFPLLDYADDQGTCVCRAHPCWNDNGMTHQCLSTKFPFLHFHHDVNGTLVCGCSSVPQYGSVHVSKDLCPGHSCESEALPVLDWAHGRSCLCRGHPCKDPALASGNAGTTECSDPQRPVLHYREDPKDGGGQPVCECLAKLEPPTRSFRGQQGPQESECVWRAVPQDL